LSIVEELYKQIGQLKVELEWLKKKLPCSLTYRKSFVDKGFTNISLTRQLELLGINKSSYYYQKVSIPEERLVLLRLVDKVYMDLYYIWDS
jgi:putative transposase